VFCCCLRRRPCLPLPCFFFWLLFRPISIFYSFLFPFSSISPNVNWGMFSLHSFLLPPMFYIPVSFPCPYWQLLPSDLFSVRHIIFSFTYILPLMPLHLDILLPMYRDPLNTSYCKSFFFRSCHSTFPRISFPATHFLFLCVFLVSLISCAYF